jgi:5-methylcytosine-specific restriction endonuclease McrA
VPHKSLEARREYMRRWRLLHKEEKAEQYKATKRQTYQKNAEHYRAYHRAYQISHHKETLEAQQRWADTNREQKRMGMRQWTRDHLGIFKAKNALRKARKLQATPKWLTKEQLEQMKQFYINCPEGYHVDHIHPLRGDGFSGLHVPWNLQYLLAIENLRKGNRLEKNGQSNQG